MQDLTLRFESPEQRGSFVKWLRENNAQLLNDPDTKFNTVDFNLDLGSIIFTQQVKEISQVSDQADGASGEEVDPTLDPKSQEPSQEPKQGKKSSK